MNLKPIQEEILRIFALLSDSSAFYLTGGTALSAFYLHHRVSEDLDIFTGQEKLITSVGNKFKDKLLKANFQVEVVREFSSFLELVATKKETIRVQLALDSPFHLGKPKITELGILVDTFLDIAVNKLLAIFGRWEVRDFVDLYFILKENLFNFDELLKKGEEKDPGLDEYYLSLALNKVKDIPDDPTHLPLILLKSLDVKEMKNLFSNYAMVLLDRIQKK